MVWIAQRIFQDFMMVFQLPPVAAEAFKLDRSSECRPKSECVSALGSCCSEPDRGTLPPNRVLKCGNQW